MGRTRKTGTRKTTISRGKSGSKAAVSRPRSVSRSDRASRISQAAGPGSAALFAESFSTFWGAIQTGQAAVLSATQKAYADMLQSFQKSWEHEMGKTRFSEACRRFTVAARDVTQDGGNAEVLEQLYREYVEELRDAWSLPELTQALEEGYLAYSEAVQKAADEAQQQVEEARKQYLRSIGETCAKIDIDNLSSGDLEALSRNMMATVFFTDGVRPAVPAG